MSKLILRTAPLTLLLLLAVGCSTPEASSVEEVENPSDTEEAVQELTPEPTEEPTPTEVPATDETPEAEAELEPVIFSERGDEMLLIPEGEFTRGSEEGFPDEVPVNTVYVDSFYLDKLEVTNEDYQACVEDGVCEAPRRTDCCTEQPGAYVAWPEYFGNPEFNDYPVIFISWFDARDYCEWRGDRLATEAEWEKASRGTDGRLYPWGNEDPSPELLNYTWPWPGGEFDERPLYTTSPVGSYPEGASPYGVLDLAGNVYEWVYDRYAADYYQVTPYENPIGPTEGEYRVTRGGSFFNQAFRNRSANRNNAFIPADSVHFDGGARCAADPPTNS